MPWPDILTGATNRSAAYLIDSEDSYRTGDGVATDGPDSAAALAVWTRVLLGAGIVTWLLGPGVAYAQPAEDAPEGRYLLGSSLSVTPAVVIVAGRDSNAIRTNIGQPAGEVYVVPQVESWLGRGRIRLNVANAVEFSRQRTAVNLNQATLNQYHVARLDVGNARLALQGIGGYRDHYAPPTDFVGFELGLKSRRIERELGANVALNPGGRISFKANVNQSALRYDADQKFQGASLQQNLNRNITLFGGEAQVALTPLSSASVSVSAYRDRFLFAPDRDGNGVRALVGGQFAPRALVSGRAEVGYLRYETLRSGAQYGGPAYNLGLSFAKTPVFLDISGRRSIEFSFDPGQGFYVSNGLDVYSSLTLGGAWEAFGRASVRGLTPKGPLATREPFRGIEVYKAGLVRRFGVATKIGTDVERYVTGGPGGFSGVRATVFMIYGSTRLQRLDRPLPGGF